MAEINGWRGLQNLAERKTGRIVVSVAERWRCCSKPVTGHLWWFAMIFSKIFDNGDSSDIGRQSAPPFFRIAVTSADFQAV